METLILGAGVIGLSAAITLERAGVRTRIVARDLPPRTTSSIAAAFWQPFKAEPQDLVADAGRISFNQFARLAKEHPQSGVTPRDGAAVFPHTMSADVWYHDLVPNYRRLARGDPLLPPDYLDGYAFSTLIIETPRYMPWILQTYRELGGRIEQRNLTTLDQATATHDLVVNCTGLGARDLCPDPAVFPARGQLVRIPQFGLTRFWLDDDNPEGITYIVPRLTDVIVGGTFTPGDFNLAPDENTAKAILHRAARLEPRITNQPILEHLVGLRPCRPAIRLEAQNLPNNKTIIHNYGHGGSGVTVSWGCAHHVLRLIQQHINTR
jgi:D-amino-acid oxidase